EQIAAMALAGPGDPLIAPVMAGLDAGDFSDPAAEAEIGWVVDLVTAIRSVRSEMNIPPVTLIPLVLSGASTETKERAQRWNDTVKRLARLADISFADRPPEGAVQLLVRGEVVALPLKGVIDLSAEKARLDKEIVKADADIKRVDAKLGNEKFVANAPEEIVEEEKEKREAADALTRSIRIASTSPSTGARGRTRPPAGIGASRQNHAARSTRSGTRVSPRAVPMTDPRACATTTPPTTARSCATPTATRLRR